MRSRYCTRQPTKSPMTSNHPNSVPVLTEILSQAVSSGLKQCFDLDIAPAEIKFEKTKKEFPGDLTLLVFPYLKASKKSPEDTARTLGEYLKQHSKIISDTNVVKGFLNIEVINNYWIELFSSISQQNDYGFQPILPNSPQVMVEFSSPNTNKPLHLGHIRNNLLGDSVAKILAANGLNVIKANLINDRGVHICKSMLAWSKWGNGETPASSSLKGDHLVGKYYVEFDKQLKSEAAPSLAESALMAEVQAMLRDWEAGKPEVRQLWERMNAWVYEGFNQTYSSLGIQFDKFYYESQTYLLGKSLVEEGLQKKVFERKEDNSVRIDLAPDGLDEKVILRSDGTSVYITQDLGTAVERFKEYPQLSRLIYTVGNEQDYHFKVLFLILQKLGYAWANECYHLSYGMVELPDGKMKSREGTVVDADDLIQQMQATAEAMTKELGKTSDYSEADAKELYHTIALGALKYFILKVDPRKKMLFNPAESIDFNGNTGPFIQYTYARIQSILRKASASDHPHSIEVKERLNNGPLLNATQLHLRERSLICLIADFPNVLKEAAKLYHPGVLASYLYDLAKEYNGFYQEVTILKEEEADLRRFRLQLSNVVADLLKRGTGLLGIKVPEKM